MQSREATTSTDYADYTDYFLDRRVDRLNYERQRVAQTLNLAF
jgi:hypothetical protein